MRAFEYASPATAELAVKALGGGSDCAVLAGGTDLINRMKDEVSTPARVVHIAGIKTLSGIDGEVVGAATTLAALVASKAIKDKYPALWQAASEVGAVQLRNMATVGGNLLQRPRCWYYRTGNGLLAMKDGKSLVRAGDNRYHAIFMTDGDALFVAPSSLAVALIALGAKATILGADGKERTVAIEDLYSVPKAEGESELTIGKGEILTKVILPKSVGKSASYEAREKQSYDWPLAIASAHVTLEGDTVKSARIVLGSVAPVPIRCEAAEAALVGKALTMETAAAAAAAAAVKSAKPLSNNAYKVKLAEVAVKRALLAAVGKTYWEG